MAESINRDIATSVSAAVKADNITSAGEVASSITVVDSTGALPLSGNSAGDRAFTTDSNGYYINNGSGWFQIGLVNANPSITAVNDSDGNAFASGFALSNTGTPVRVTITATDPENIPIVFSVVSDAGFDSMATVSQDGQVFTITPFSKDSAVTTSGNLTFTASDGVNVATAIRTFTLSFAIDNSNLTQFLLRAEGNNGTNTSITDGSSNNHTITVNGGAAINTFTPYHPKGYSLLFDGSGDDIAVSSQLVPAGPFTVQAWVNFNHTGTSTVWSQGTSGNAGRTGVGRSSTGSWFGQIGSTDAGGNTDIGPQPYVWYFTELQWDGSTLKFFVDGFLQGSQSTSQNPENTTFRVGSLGSAWNTSYDLNGRVADVKVISGTPSGTSTVPDSRLSDETNCEFLGANLPYIADASSNGRSITVNGNTKISTVAPPIDYTYSPSDGTSVYFDGTNDQMIVPAAAWDRDADYTVECWMYATDKHYVAMSRNRQAADGIIFMLLASGEVFFGVGRDNVNNWDLTYTGSVDLRDQWVHLALTHDASEKRYKIYVNGVNIFNNTSSYHPGSLNAVVNIGCGDTMNSGTTNYGTGWISDHRIVNSIVYTSDFTPPTVPLAAISNTSLLTCNSASKIFDTANVRQLHLYGDTKSSTAQTKNNSSSIYFDGTGDHILLDNVGNMIQANDPFTFEAWIRPNDISNVGIVNFTGTPGTLDQTLYISSDGNLSFYDAADITANSGGGFTANTWHHVAMVRNAADYKVRVFLDGTRKNTSSSAYTTALASNAEIGRYSSAGTNNFTGYMEDIKLTRAVKYPFFADPTLNFNTESKTNVKLLTGHTSTIVDGSDNNHTITDGVSFGASGFGPGPGMNSISFDGSNDYIRCDAALDDFTSTSDQFTIEGWAYFNTTSTSLECVLGINRASDGYNHLLFGVGPNTHWTVYWDNNTGYDTGVDVVAKKWTHWALMYDGSQLRIFIDGAHIHSENRTASRALSTCTLLFGAEADSGNGGTLGNYFDGYLSNIRITSGQRYSLGFTPPTEALTG